MKKFLKSLSIALAVLLATTLSVAVIAEESSEVSDVSVVSESSDASAVSDSSDASSTSSVSDASDASSAASESSEASAQTSSEAATESTTAPTESEEGNDFWKDFPWARVITLVVILVLILVAFILAKTKTALGQKIAKFFKEYWSEIKKVSWYSPKDTLKATGVVLVFLIVAAVAIGVLDFGFTKLIQLLATAFN